MKRALFLVTIVGCAHTDTVKTAEPDPAPKPGPPAASLSFVHDAPKGGSGACRGDSVNSVESRRARPSCPDPMAWTEPDGLGGDASKLPAVKPSAMPPWDVERMRDFACAYACAPAGSAAHLLAWEIVEEKETRLRNHQAVFVVEQAIQGPPKWTLVIMTRNATADYWRLPVIWDTPILPIHDYRQPPSDEEISTQLDLNRFSFDASILAGNVLDPLWKAVTKKAPSRFFPNGIEQP